MKEDLLKIINHYGLANQLKYIHSEYYELDEAILHYENSKCFNDEYGVDDNKHIIEELSDCFVMLKQLQYYYGIEDSEIKKIMREKIDRQLNRIEDEKAGWEFINKGEE